MKLQDVISPKKIQADIHKVTQSMKQRNENTDRKVIQNKVTSNKDSTQKQEDRTDRSGSNTHEMPGYERCQETRGNKKSVPNINNKKSVPNINNKNPVPNDTNENKDKSLPNTTNESNLTINPSSYKMQRL